MNQTMHLMSDKRGSTLIEVIVSVLIVGIAFVPLMVGLNAAMNINKQTENELYAENVAANVVEVCKTYGAKGLRALSKSAESTSAESTSAESTSAESTSGGDVIRISDIFDGSEIEMISNDEYVIKNITSGTTKNFTAKVVFSGWDDKQNDFSGYPSVEGVKDAIVVSFDEDSFNSIFTDYFWAYAESKATYDASTHLSKDEMIANIGYWLKRDIYVKLDKVPAESGSGEKIVVSKEIVYTANNNEIPGTGKYPFRESSSSAVPAPLHVQQMPDPSESSSAPVGKYSVVPQMIVVTYKQFKDSKGRNLKLNGTDGDIIHLIKNVSGQIYLYALSENGRTLKELGYNAKIDGEDSVDPASPPMIHAYSNLNLMSWLGCEKEETFGTADMGEMSKMKNVTITILEGTKEVASKTSTIIEME